ncbi:BglG family transcription antiterminator [Candidatus Arthromitus sp. SFB-rat-Yit]|uniref:BglG family transcription antiterminator n=1 Tax=Candidatus Arthromitus sp. SFB-rat-Yit TaxID=1041504 RepID=UPI0002D506B8|nr:BglG family transcription antiterminator [Candidatus Arthromitus sp. SFB-rat-Yit]
MRLLLWENDYVSLQKIADITGVSRRSIYYDLCNINEWLEERGIKELEVERGKGILLSQEDKFKIKESLEEKISEKYYVFLPSERVEIIICYIVHSRKPVYINHIMDVCKVSRNTVFGDMKIAIQKLRKYELDLKYESKKGYEVVGDAVRKCALFFLYFNKLRALFNEGVLNFFDREKIYKNYECLNLLKNELKIEYMEGDLLSLAALMPVMHNYREKLHFSGLKKEEIFRIKEFQLVEKYFDELEENEKIYLCLHLLASRVSVATDKFFEDRADQSVYGITKALVTEFEKTACVNFEDKEELERALFVHIKTSMYRYKYGIQIGNPFGNDIIREYPNLFDITRKVSRYLEQIIGLPIPDSEVAYLSLHFGAYLKVCKYQGNKLRILIVCVNGISTGNMIKREVLKLLSDIEIVGVVSAVDIINAQDICDLIISTVNIKTIVPVIVVNPILMDEDREYILNHHMVHGVQKNKISNLLFNTIKKYVDKSQYKNLQKDIVQCLQGHSKNLDISVSEKENGILECLSLSKIMISDESLVLQDSVYLAGECLVENGSIEKRYLDVINFQTMYYGSYMFITDRIMLAHAKPEDGVNKMDISMAVFKNPILFREGKRAEIIFVLAAVDHERHLKILNDIFKIAEDKDIIERFVNANTKMEIFEILNEIL